MSTQDFLKDILPKIVVVILGGVITTFVLNNSNLDIRLKLIILIILLLSSLSILFWSKFKDVFRKMRGEARIKELEDAIRNQVVTLKRIVPTLHESIEQLTKKLDNQDDDIVSIKKVIEDLNQLKNEADNLVQGINLVDSLPDERRQTIERDRDRKKQRGRANTEKP